MPLAQPPGVRSCRDGGVWDCCRDGDGRNYWIHEMKRLAGHLTEIEFRLTQQELLQKLRRAERGECTYGSGPQFDVEEMVCTTDVLELRLTTRTGEDDDTFLLRLYFSEPASVPRQLLALMFAWKRPGPVGLEEQTGHAQTASRRAHEHSLRG